MRPITRRRFLTASAAAAAVATVPGVALAAGSGAYDPRWPSHLRRPGSRPDPNRPAGTPDPRMPFDHVVVIMQENHSFDNYFGMLPMRGQPRADGFTFDRHRRPINANPVDHEWQRVFRLQGTCQPNGVTQSWNATHQQINHGRMDGFAATDTEAMGYWDEPDIPFYYSLAKTFCLGNRYFSSVPAQTYPNRRMLYSGTADGMVSSSNSTFTMPPPANGTLFDRLSDHGISWTDYFSDLPVAGIIPSTVENHPANFNHMSAFYAACATGTLPAVSFVDGEAGALGDFLGPGTTFGSVPGSLPPALGQYAQEAASQGGDEENPQDIAIGEGIVSRVVNAVLQSPAWPRTLLVWTYDEHGGYYDHVAPPAAIVPDDVPPAIGPHDYPGRYDMYGIRVPNVVVSPYSKPNAVTNVVHDHTSVIATIAAKWNLPALTYRDANASTLMDYLDVRRAAFIEPPVLAAPSKPAILSDTCRTSPQPVVLQPNPGPTN